jgi:16S rRNA (cytosine1402-N4)-methyltransferase
MRFDPASEKTAYHVVNESTEEELAEVLRRFGEERRARRLSREIVRGRPIETTIQLAALVARVAGPSRRGRIHPATRTFQAIRMAVNSEIENLGSGLMQAIQTLATGGRMAVISYHSVEDRVVKETFRREASACICPPGTPECICGHEPTIRRVNRKVIKPARSEVQANPRSRSAHLRLAERISGPA